MKKALFVYLFVFMFLNTIHAQFYINPYSGISFANTKIVQPSKYLVNFHNDNPCFGLSFGYKNKKINHSLGYLYHTIGITYFIADLPYFGIGNGHKNVENHNIYYDFTYNLLKWRKLNINTGLSLYASKSISTSPSNNEILFGLNEINNGIKVNGTIFLKTLPGKQFFVAPHIDIELQLLKKIAWNTNFSYMIGSRSIYTGTGNIALDNVQQAEGKLKMDGSGLLINSGFKLYFKQKKPKE